MNLLGLQNIRTWFQIVCSVILQVYNCSEGLGTRNMRSVGRVRAIRRPCLLSRTRFGVSIGNHTVSSSIWN